MPVYNGGPLLREALASLARQSFRDYQFVVVDDGSTDDTQKILATWNDHRIQVETIAHVGLIGALNRGMELCRGEYIARMDADDISYPRRLQTQVEWLDQHPETDVVSCGVDLLSAEGDTLGRHPDFQTEQMFWELAAGNPIVHGSVMMRRSSLPPAPVYQQPPEDYALWISLVRAGRRFDLLPDVLYGFREHPERYSLRQATRQCADALPLQWELLTQAMSEFGKSPSLQKPRCLRLVRGWGTVAGAAWKSQQPQQARAAMEHFRALTKGRWDNALAEAANHAIEAMIWGGCPLATALRLRWRQCRQRPFSFRSYRQLLTTLPFLVSLVRVARRIFYRPPKNDTCKQKKNDD